MKYIRTGEEIPDTGTPVDLFVTSKMGQWLELVDGGAVDWTQKLLSSAKDGWLINGIGSRRVCGEYRI